MEKVLIERRLQNDEEKINKIFVSLYGKDFRSLRWNYQYYSENKWKRVSIGICDFQIYKELFENEVIGKRLAHKMEFYVDCRYFENIVKNNMREIKKINRLYVFSILKQLCFGIIVIGFGFGITPLILTSSFDFFTRWNITWLGLFVIIFSLVGFLLCLWLNNRFGITEKHQLLKDYKNHIFRDKKNYLFPLEELKFN